MVPKHVNDTHTNKRTHQQIAIPPGGGNNGIKTCIYEPHYLASKSFGLAFASKDNHTMAYTGDSNKADTDTDDGISHVMRQWLLINSYRNM